MNNLKAATLATVMIILAGCGTTRRDVGRVADNIGPGSTRIQPAVDARNGFVPATYAVQPTAAPPLVQQPTQVLPGAAPIGGQPPVVAAPSPQAMPGYAPPAQLAPGYAVNPQSLGMAPVPNFVGPGPLAFVGPGTGSVFIPAGGGPLAVTPTPAAVAGSVGPGAAAVARVSGFLSETDFGRRGVRLHPRLSADGPMAAPSPTPLPAMDDREPPRRAEPPVDRRPREAAGPGPLTTPPPPADAADPAPRRRQPSGGPEFEPPRNLPGTESRPGAVPKSPAGNPLFDEVPPDFRAPSKKDLAVPNAKKSG